MEKNITRTVTLIDYIYGNVDIKAGKITDMEVHTYPYQLSPRAKAQLDKEVGKPCLKVEATEVKYSMSLEDFIKYAKVVDNDTDKEDGEKND